MREILIKFLGGYTPLELEKANYFGRDESDRQVRYYQELLNARDEEIKRLTNLMLIRAGFIAPLTSQTEINQHEPINKRQSWPARQRELQQQDAKRAADLTAERWAKKAGDLVQQELKDNEEKLNASKVS